MTERRSTPSRFELVGEYPGVLRITAWENVTVCMWSGQADGPATMELERSMDRRGTRVRRLSYIHLIRDRLALPDADARRNFRHMMTRRNAELACVAIVVGGTGFWASAMRNAVIGLRVLSPRDFTFRIHGSTSEVLDWLPTMHEERTGVAVSRELLRALLEQAHAQAA